MYKIVLKDMEFTALKRPTDNSFSVVVGKEEIENVLKICTIENLKEIVFIEAEGVYSVQTDKQYAGKYGVEETEGGVILTIYVKNVDKEIIAMEEFKQSQILQDDAIIELAELMGGM